MDDFFTDFGSYNFYTPNYNYSYTPSYEFSYVSFNTSLSNYAYNSDSGTLDNGNTWSGSPSNGSWVAYSSFDSNSDEGWSRIDYTSHNSTTNLWGTISTYNDNGSLQSYIFNDVNNTSPDYVNYTNSYDANGVLIGSTGTLDNGNTWSGSLSNGSWDAYTSYDANGDEGWSRIDYTNYSLASDKWESVSYLNDNGTLQSYSFNDVNNTSAAYVSYTNTYDSNGIQTSSVGTLDNGNTWSGSLSNGSWNAYTSYDSNGDEGWSRIDYANSDPVTGEWETISVQQRDGTRDETVKDLHDRVDWSQVNRHWDSAAQLVSEVVSNDDGTSVATQIDRSPAAETVRTDEVRDTHGTLVGTATTLQDRSQIVTLANVEGQTVKQTLEWDGNQLSIEPTAGPALTIPLVASVLEQALIFFGAAAAVTAVHEYGVKPFIAFYRGSEGTGDQTRVSVGTLSDARVNEVCPNTGTFQALTTSTALGIDKTGMTPQAYGTAVHSAMKAEINALSNGSDNLKAEYSLIEGDDARYGQVGSTRLDIFNYIPSTNTVCVYDIKTGTRGLDASQATRIYNEAKEWKNGANVMIIELRP
jgi:hypothetical protein